MRVWALASCSGLLALAACSAEQSSSPNPSAAPLEGEDAANIQTQPRLSATASSPMARPETRPRQVIQGGYRLSSAPGKSVASGGKALPQAAELRQRLERLRRQQGSRLSSSTPLVTAPQPATLARPALSPSRPAHPTAESETPAFNAIQGSNFSTQRITPLPTPFRPVPINPEVAPEADISTASAADLGEVAATSVARNYPIAPIRHQGYSARAQRPAPVLSVARTAAEAQPARLHGGIVTAQQPETVTSAGANNSQVAIVEGSTSPEPSGTPADGSRAELAVRPASLAPESPRPVSSGPQSSGLDSAASAPLTAGSHLSSGPVALTPTAVPLNSPTSSETHQSQGRSAEVGSDPVGQSPVLWESVRAEPAIRVAPRSAIAPPESLPLNPPSPLSSLVRSQAPEVAAETEDSTAEVDGSAATAMPERTAARIAAPAHSTFPSPDSLQPEAGALDAGAPEAAAAPGLHHQSQSSSAAVRLIPTASNTPKGLSMAYCLSPSGQLVPTALEADGSSASLPKFSASSAVDPSLAQAPDLDKGDPAEPCVGLPSATSEFAPTPLSPSLDAQPQP